MPFTAGQNTVFFTNGPQMALSNAARQRLALEGLTVVEDFEDFKKEQINEALKNMRVAIPGIPGIPGAAALLNPDGSVQVPALAAIPPIPAVPPMLISAKCSLRLKAASATYHFYVSVDRIPTPANMNYTIVVKPFYVEYESIVKLSEKDKPDVPVIHKNLAPIRWVESFKDCLYRTFGVRDVPLLYVIRDEVEVKPEADDPLEGSHAYGSSGSVLDELIQRISHTHPLFKSDNASVYSMLEEATRGSIYASSIKTYARNKNGRNAWLSMVSSHAGKDKWEQLQKDKMKFIMNTKWNGRSYSLEKNCGIHRTAYVQMEEAALHVEFQLPNEHSRVGYLIDNIVNSNPDLRAAIAQVRVDRDGMRKDFESTVTYVLPVDPFMKKPSGNQGRNPQISAAVLQNKSKSRTGVDFTWHKPEEYKKLTPAQKKELYTWQSTKEGQAIIAKQKAAAGITSKNQSAKRKLQAKIKALEAKVNGYEGQGEPTDGGVTLDQLETVIASVVASRAPNQPVIAPRASVSSAAVQLQSILSQNKKRKTTFEDSA